MAIAAGVATNVLLVLGRRGYSDARVATRLADMPQFRTIGEFENPVGAIAPAQLYAPMARRHMEMYGTTAEQFAEVAVAMREHAMLNDNAIMQKLGYPRYGLYGDARKFGDVFDLRAKGNFRFE